MKCVLGMALAVTVKDAVAFAVAVVNTIFHTLTHIRMHDIRDTPLG